MCSLTAFVQKNANSCVLTYERYSLTDVPYVGTRIYIGKFRLELRERVGGRQSIFLIRRPRQMIDWSYDGLRIGIHVSGKKKKNIKPP